MKYTKNSTYDRARKFIYRNARPLDLARFRYQFEGGGKEDILTALAAYQNDDGGFGNALEADFWNPNSSPMQTSYAIGILREINFTDCTHSVISGILRYLNSGASFDGRVWHRTIPSNNDYPHAQWWHYEKDEKFLYNPTAAIIGFLLLCGISKGNPMYQTALRLAGEAIEYYLKSANIEFHEIGCFVELLGDMEKAGVTNISGFAAFREKVIKDASGAIEKDSSKWEHTYCCKPSQLIKSRSSILYKNNESLCNSECGLIIKTQLESGEWAVTWRWEKYPAEFAVSANWWQSVAAIGNLMYLKELGRLE